MDYVIVAPHPDDELIGCFGIINNNENKIIVLYTESVPNERKNEALKLKENFKSVTAQLFFSDIPSALLTPNNTLLFPDPSYETHPAHRMWGSYGERLLRKSKSNVIFYSTNMNAPYIHEVEFAGLKEITLNKIYPSQKSLWEYEKKFFLFEGRCKWLMS